MKTMGPGARPYVGNFVAWDGGCLLIGVGGAVVPVHAHYAIQIAFGAERGIRFRGDDREPWVEYGAVVIPSRQPHSMDATAVQPNAVLFVEPETHEGRAIAERHLLGDERRVRADAADQRRCHAVLEP